MLGPGKTAPLLLQNLLTYDPRYELAAGRNLLTSPPPHHDPHAAPTSSVPRRNCRHDVQLKEEQSELPQRGVDPDENTVYRVAVYCRICRWHFDVWVDFRDNGSQNCPCRKTDLRSPLHHFLYSGEEDPSRSGSLGGHAKPRSYTFYCSADKCPVALRIRISPPQLSDSDIALLTDPANLRRRWERAKEIDGARADADMAQPIEGPNYLNTYLYDSFNSTKAKPRIPLLNRKFLKTFGRDCDDMLKKLGFTFAVEVDAEGNSSDGWYLPRPSEPQRPLDSLETTTRSIVEDARYELNAVLLSFPESERSTARRNPLALVPARHHIELALGCDDYELREGGRRETRNSHREEDHPYYAGLGALSDFADRLLIFAYDRQVANDPINTPYYFECLRDLAKGRNSETLDTQSAILESQGLFTRQDVTQAYRTLGIDPSHGPALSDDIITNQFKARLSDIGPRQVEEARSALRIIGLAKDSDMIQRAASNSIETYAEALAWLNLPDSVELSGDDFVITMYTSKVNDSPQEAETGRMAVKIIADQRKSHRLRQWLETGQMDAAEMDAAEAYATLGITDRSSKLDPSVLQTLYEGMLSDSPENAQRLETALQKVRQDQENSHGSEQQQPSGHNFELHEWPVGCCNIGNTCYLNSVLQFLFTIKPLRDMVIDCDKHFQDLSAEALESKRVGRTAVTRARAETGQQFVRELQGLFKLMITAKEHNIRPERSLAALALTRGESTDIASESKPPTRPSSRLGKIGDMPVSGPVLPPGFQMTSMPPSPADSVMGDAEGDADSMKAMDLTASSEKPDNIVSARPQPPSRPPPIPPRPQATADIGLKKLEDVAQQQDAAEILNNVFDLLSCAFQGEDVLQDGEQLDLIKRTFFSNVTTVRKTKDKDIPKSDLQDNVLVSTKGRDRTICAALDDEFGLTELEGDVTKYEIFDTAAPIQIINVRRLQFENGRARKDESHLALDKILYLDRYLKSTKSLSEEQLQELRNQQWQLQAELKALETRKKLLKETDFKDVDLPDVLDETAFLLTKLEGLSPDAAGESPQPSPEQRDPSPGPQEGIADQLNKRADELRPELTDIHKRMEKLEKQIDSVFEDCNDHPYRLHAIFMHAGSHSGGHYWIYIYDFQNDIWRKYNDETVTLESEETILKKIDQVRPPTSTGIVYVRDDVATEYTEALHRDLQEAGSQTDETQPGDVEMTDAPSSNVLNMDDYTNLEVVEGREMYGPLSSPDSQVVSHSSLVFTKPGQLVHYDSDTSISPNPHSPPRPERRDPDACHSLNRMVQAVQLNRRPGNPPTIWQFPKPRNKRIARDFTPLSSNSPDKKARIAGNECRQELLKRAQESEEKKAADAFRDELLKKVQFRESEESRTAKKGFREALREPARPQEIEGSRRAENAFGKVLELHQKLQSQESEEIREIRTEVNAYKEMLQKRARYQENKETDKVEEDVDGVYQKALEETKGDFEEMIMESIKQAIEETTTQRGIITESTVPPNKVRCAESEKSGLLGEELTDETRQVVQETFGEIDKEGKMMHGFEQMMQDMNEGIAQMKRDMGFLAEATEEEITQAAQGEFREKRTEEMTHGVEEQMMQKIKEEIALVKSAPWLKHLRS
ncbi:hypothetical protein PMIN07_001825 [Paraphaeosphaeria minitans]